jgi:hypothetical protein
MHEARCTICGRGHRPAEPAITDEYNLTFADDVCELCAITLGRALAGILELLRDSHGERRERVIDRLSTRLRGQGFEVGDTFRPRRAS